MQRLFLISGFFLLSLHIHAQDQLALEAEQWTDNEITEFFSGMPDAAEPIILDAKPLFLKQAVVEAFQALKYPTIARENGVTGTVKIRVHLDANGRYISAVPVQKIGAGCDQEALFMVQKIIRRGVKPAEKSGVAVPVIFDFPVKFTLH
ncbi:MAG: energy transducer TonB [Saprospiraceae bacterium]|nr:energy transducer TonB [Saprospiraceae bacterium]